jgi:hypothetical protein
MSSTRQASSSTSNIQLIIDALVDYSKVTGIDLSKNPFSATIEQSSSTEAVLKLLQGRESAFKEYRNGNRRLIDCLSPAVRILQAFSGILGETVNLVSHLCRLIGFSKRDLVRSPSHQQTYCLLESILSFRCVPLICPSNSSHLMNAYFRLPAGFRLVMTPC